MAYYYTQEEIARLQMVRKLCPSSDKNSTSSGN